MVYASIAFILIFIGVLILTFILREGTFIPRTNGYGEIQRPCPLCRKDSPLLCDVECERDPADGKDLTFALLWECKTHGCFNNKGKVYGVRRRCLDCKHKENPSLAGWCMCIFKNEDGTYDKCCDGSCMYEPGSSPLLWQPSENS